MQDGWMAGATAEWREKEEMGEEKKSQRFRRAMQWVIIIMALELQLAVRGLCEAQSGRTRFHNGKGKQRQPRDRIGGMTHWCVRGTDPTNTRDGSGGMGWGSLFPKGVSGTGARRGGGSSIRIMRMMRDGTSRLPRGVAVVLVARPRD